MMEAEPGTLLVLMRHGKTLANDPKNPKVRGWMDSPLSPEGKIDVQVEAQKLRFFNFKAIISSDFMRDIQTAHLVGDALKLSPEVDYNVRTWDTGNYSGKPEGEVNQAIGEIYKKPWLKPPGSSESFDEFSRRWLKFLDNQLTLAGSGPAFRPTLIVTHGRNIALSHSYLSGIPSWEAEMPMPARSAVISVADHGLLEIELDQDKEPILSDV
jgi:broad specificity phosphatase PhoE